MSEQITVWTLDAAAGFGATVDAESIRRLTRWAEGEAQRMQTRVAERAAEEILTMEQRQAGQSMAGSPQSGSHAGARL